MYHQKRNKTGKFAIDPNEIIINKRDNEIDVEQLIDVPIPSYIKPMMDKEVNF